MPAQFATTGYRESSDYEREDEQNEALREESRLECKFKPMVARGESMVDILTGTKLTLKNLSAFRGARGYI